MFRVEIDTDNAAFEDDPPAEIARILRDAADKIGGRRQASGPLFDINGNRVGRYRLELADEDEDA